MRQIALVSTLGALLLLAGCNTTKWNMFRGTEQQRDLGPQVTPTAAALVNYLNANSDLVQSVRCDQLDLQCRQGIKPGVGATGKLVCQKPLNLRMSAYVFGKQEIDLGSNSQEFWYWIARGDPYQFHCSYKALSEGRVRQLPFPFQPDWILEAMGLARFGPADRYQVVQRRDTIELVERTRSPQGKPVRKVTVFRSVRAPAGSPQVVAHLLLDDTTGKEICSATITHVQMVQADRQNKVEVPRKMVLNWPDAKIQLSLTLDDVTVNGEISRPDLLFTRRPLTNVKSFDLAEWRVDSGAIRQVEGQVR